MLAAGTGSLGVGWYASRSRRETLDVRVWFSERAATHDGLEERVAGYLEPALADAYGSVALEFGGSVDVSAERGAKLMRLEWPGLVALGFAGLGPVEPARDVNLLVTDGDPRKTPAGYGMSNVATVTGARYLARAPPREAIDDVADYSIPLAVAQLLLHETGHALGLDHADGSATVEDGAIVASPMVSGYAWADADGDHEGASACAAPSCDRARERRLELGYTSSERAALRSYRGGVLP